MRNPLGAAAAPRRSGRRPLRSSPGCWASRPCTACDGPGGCASRRHHGAERLELACALALELGDPSYRTVKGILAAGREQPVPEEETTTLAPAHLHGPDTLFAHLEA